VEERDMQSDPTRHAEAGKSIRHVTMEEMLTRVARYDALKASKEAFVDSLVPGHEREIINVIGHGVTEDAGLSPAITDAQDFHLTLIRAEPGKGAALHSHKTLEVFMALSGSWAVFWGDQGEQEIVLEQWDTISVPVGVMRGFRNAGKEYALLMSVLGGTDPGRVTWASQVLEAARKSPLRLDARGNVERVG
jgi:uncharacterized RmlC-like cupin family protein